MGKEKATRQYARHITPCPGIGARVKEARLAKGLVVHQAAVAAGCTDSQFYRVEAGHSAPGAAFLRGLCLALGVSADWLLGLKEER